MWDTLRPLQRKIIRRTHDGEVLSRHGAVYFKGAKSPIAWNAVGALYDKGLIEPRYVVGQYGPIRLTEAGQAMLDAVLAK